MIIFVFTINFQLIQLFLYFPFTGQTESKLSFLLTFLILLNFILFTRIMKVPFWEQLIYCRYYYYFYY